jgi:hypothetical protein
MLKKIITTVAVVATIFFVAIPAFAQHRGYYGHSFRSVTPYVLGGTALGILGGAIIADQYYRPYCRDLIVGRRWNGYRWVSQYETVCD